MCKMHYTTAIKLIFILSIASKVCGMELEYKSPGISATFEKVTKKFMLTLLQETAQNEMTFHKPKHVLIEPIERDLTGAAPILCVAQTGDLEGARLLLGLDGVEQLQEYEHEGGVNALHIAAERGHDALVALFLHSGFKLEHRDRFKRTPLLRAARYGQTNTVLLLLAHGANKAALDKNGFTALDNAILTEKQDLVALLYDEGVEQKMPITLTGGLTN